MHGERIDGLFVNEQMSTLNPALFLHKETCIYMTRLITSIALWGTSEKAFKKI